MPFLIKKVMNSKTIVFINIPIFRFKYICLNLGNWLKNDYVAGLERADSTVVSGIGLFVNNLVTIRSQSAVSKDIVDKLSGILLEL